MGVTGVHNTKKKRGNAALDEKTLKKHCKKK